MNYPKRILVVDDDLSMCALLSYMLGEYDYTVVVRHDGQQAMTLLATDHSFDLIIADLMMPRMNGADLLQQLRKHYPAIPIILSTTASHDAIQGMGVKQAADEFLPRPFTIQQLHETIDRTLARNAGRASRSEWDAQGSSID